MIAAAGCTSDNPLNTQAQKLVVKGQVTGDGTPLVAALVHASADGDSGTDTTDSQGLYRLELNALPDSVELCVSAAGFLDTCMHFTFPPETLLVDLGLTGRPRDTVWVTADTVTAGETAELILGLSNPDSALAGLNLWLRSASPDIVFDTVFLESPRFPVSGMEWNVVRHDSINTIAILLIDFQGVVQIPPGSGPLMRLRYQVGPAQAPGSVTLDTTSAVVVRPIDIAYPSGLSAPGVVFRSGLIVVR